MGTSLTKNSPTRAKMDFQRTLQWALSGPKQWKGDNTANWSVVIWLVIVVFLMLFVLSEKSPSVLEAMSKVDSPAEPAPVPPPR
jgi:hypothetical protein